MLENARQGFWNGSKPPLGYRTIAVEQRGQRTKKRLEIEATESRDGAAIFKLFLQGDGRSGPMGVKDIASWLNAHGHTFGNGGLFYTSAVHAILTRETYSGTHTSTGTTAAQSAQDPRRNGCAGSPGDHSGEDLQARPESSLRHAVRM